MVINGKSLLSLAPIRDMKFSKLTSPGGVTYGLGEAGYDIRIDQDIEYIPTKYNIDASIKRGPMISRDRVGSYGNFILASTMEEFNMPTNLVGIVHDKSSWARQGLSVFNTVIEPGWAGILTLELMFHGPDPVTIPKGAGIAQVIFTTTKEVRGYKGRYQNQPSGPVPAIKA